MNKDNRIATHNHETDKIREENGLLIRALIDLQDENEQLKAKLNDAIAYNNSSINRKLTSTNEALEKAAIKQNQMIVRLFDAIESMIDKMLRQTIAMKTHSERNQDMRRWASELLQILRITDDDLEPFDPPF